MKRRLFGTDGIRGTANSEPMTAETALRVGMAAGREFTRGDHRHLVVIGKDTRLSGYLLEPALTAGFISMGMDVTLVGPMPTPAVAMLTRSLRADLGVMISASHNPFRDNGIKLFGPDGYKLFDEVEAKIERRMENGFDAEFSAPESLGRARRLDDVEGRYIEFAKGTFPRGLRLDGLKIVVDCANGAAYRVAPRVLWELGAEVEAIGVQPNGLNINEGCGSTNPGLLCKAVIEQGADLGIALDGDADRLLIADEKGKRIDGDQVIALISDFWRRREQLKGGVIATVMSNLGLEHHLRENGIDLLRTQVGDRYVVERMRQEGYNLGGEPSGHIVLADYNTTGDGLIAALQVLAVLVEKGEPLSRVGRVFEPLPQLLRNVRFHMADPLRTPAVRKAIAEGEAKLGSGGRLLVRESGTEPLIRVMAEGENEDLLHRVVDRVAEAIEGTAGPQREQRA